MPPKKTTNPKKKPAQKKPAAKKPADPKPFKTWVVWGDEPTVAGLLDTELQHNKGKLTAASIDKRVHQYEFATLAELLAFTVGVEQSEGWTAAYLGDSHEDAADYLRQVASERCKGIYHDYEGQKETTDQGTD